MSGEKLVSIVQHFGRNTKSILLFFVKVKWVRSHSMMLEVWSFIVKTFLAIAGTDCFVHLFCKSNLWFLVFVICRTEQCGLNQTFLSQFVIKEDSFTNCGWAFFLALVFLFKPAWLWKGKRGSFTKLGSVLHWKRNFGFWKLLNLFWIFLP